jgi:hypothetical protein
VLELAHGVHAPIYIQKPQGTDVVLQSVSHKILPNVLYRNVPLLPHPREM